MTVNAETYSLESTPHDQKVGCELDSVKITGLVGVMRTSWVLVIIRSLVEVSREYLPVVSSRFLK